MSPRRNDAQHLSIGDCVTSESGPKLAGSNAEDCFVTNLNLQSDGSIQVGWQRLDTAMGSQPSTSVRPAGRTWTVEERESILARKREDDEWGREQRSLDATPGALSAAIEQSLDWLIAVVEHEVAPPESCGACGTPNAQCDGSCADAVYHAEGMRKARTLLAAMKQRSAAAQPKGGGA